MVNYTHTSTGRSYMIVGIGTSEISGSRDVIGHVTNRLAVHDDQL